MHAFTRLIFVSYLMACSLFAAASYSAGTELHAVGSRDDAELVATLLRSTLIGLHHANVTGNYTVFRDLGSPQFRSDNSAADLSQFFYPLRQAGIDLESVAVLQPSMTLPPKIIDNQFLALEGRFATLPVAFEFVVTFELVERTWFLSSVIVRPQSEP